MSITAVPRNTAQERADEIRDARLAQRRDDAARHLVALYTERVRLARLLAELERPDGGDVDAVLAAGRDLEKACQAFRRRFYPRKARCTVGLYQVMVASATNRNVETVLDLFDEYVPQVDS